MQQKGMVTEVLIFLCVKKKVIFWNQMGMIKCQYFHFWMKYSLTHIYQYYLKDDTRTHNTRVKPWLNAAMGRNEDRRAVLPRQTSKPTAFSPSFSKLK